MDRITKRKDDCVYVGNLGWSKGNNDAIFKLAEFEDAEEQNRLVMLPFDMENPIYVICKCENISMYHDNDYLTGTGAIECPFENQCQFEDCKDEQSQIIETIIECVFINEDGLQFGLNNINYGHPTYSIQDIGKTVFLTKEEAEAILNG